MYVCVHIGENDQYAVGHSLIHCSSSLLHYWPPTASRTFSSMAMRRHLRFLGTTLQPRSCGLLKVMDWRAMITVGLILPSFSLS